jgi:hypothetical protein
MPSPYDAITKQWLASVEQERKDKQAREKAEYDKSHPFTKSGSPFNQVETKLAQQAVDMTNAIGLENPTTWKWKYNENLKKLTDDYYSKSSVPRTERKYSHLRYGELPDVEFVDGQGRLATAKQSGLLDKPGAEALRAPENKKLIKAAQEAATEAINQPKIKPEQYGEFIKGWMNKFYPEFGGIEKTPDYIVEAAKRSAQTGEPVSNIVKEETTPESVKTGWQDVIKLREQLYPTASKETTPAVEKPVPVVQQQRTEIDRLRDAINKIESSIPSVKSGASEYGQKVSDVSQRISEVKPEPEIELVNDTPKISEVRNAKDLNKLKQSLDNMSASDLIKYAESHIPQSTKDEYAARQQDEIDAKKQAEQDAAVQKQKQEREYLGLKPGEELTGSYVPSEKSIYEGGARKPTRDEMAAEVERRKQITMSGGSPFKAAYEEEA